MIKQLENQIRDLQKELAEIQKDRAVLRLQPCRGDSEIRGKEATNLPVLIILHSAVWAHEKNPSFPTRRHQQSLLHRSYCPPPKTRIPPFYCWYPKTHPTPAQLTYRTHSSYRGRRSRYRLRGWERRGGESDWGGERRWEEGGKLHLMP
jgi:hypothetical protein